MPRLRQAVVMLAGLLAGCILQGVIHQRPSQHGLIIVSEDAPGFRTLRFAADGARQSVVKLGDPAHLELSYLRAALAGLALTGEPRRMLVIGLGGGSLPSFLRRYYPDAVIDVAEIDPEVLDVASQYFGFVEDSKMKVHIGDGRAFVEQAAAAAYDVIFLDAFGAYSVPRHLATEEFLRAVRRALAPNGVVVGNVWNRSANPLYDAMVRTYEAVFQSIYVINVEGDVNRIVLGIPRKLTLSADTLAARARDVSRSEGFRFDLGDIVKRGWVSPQDMRGAAAVLRDQQR